MYQPLPEARDVLLHKWASTYKLSCNGTASEPVDLVCMPFFVLPPHPPNEHGLCHEHAVASAILFTHL
ncbi:hypothetical protein BVC80_9051g60 [Macleaya cordata]|uniref:Uncharacterized protein n=1 Tax=Macleaya cordata TaxID=56857 RepID=A0A200RA06_MACCD|nr:hypothetical protein BVC80_9051g60 [Macleaya cordata]